MRLFTILHDDGDVLRYQLYRRISRASFEIVDEYRDLHVLHRSIPKQMGGTGVLIGGPNGTTEQSYPTGVVAYSLEPEVLAAQKAFAHILSLQVKQGQCLRWFTDSKSCVDNLRYGEAMMSLWNTIQEVLKSKVSIEVVWVPIHCGL